MAGHLYPAAPCLCHQSCGPPFQYQFQDQPQLAVENTRRQTLWLRIHAAFPHLQRHIFEKIQAFQPLMGLSFPWQVLKLQQRLHRDLSHLKCESSLVTS